METKNRPVRPGGPSGRRPGSPKRKRPSVVYTDPKSFSARRLVLRLVTAAAVTLAVLFGVSIFFKVNLQKVTVSGADKYSVNEVITASGIRNGSNLLSLSNAKISGRIIAKLPYVRDVRVGIKLPDTVHIEITELDVAYAVEGSDGAWWLMDSKGKVVDTVSADEAKTYTVIQGIKLESPVAGQQAVAWEEDAAAPEETTAPAQTDAPPAETAGDASQPPQTAAPESAPAGNGSGERLSIALEILQQLETSGIVGQAASVNVTDPAQLEMWYGSRYQVALGNRERLDYKISLVKSAIDQMGEHQGGKLDVSFESWQELAYTPFAP